MADTNKEWYTIQELVDMFNVNYSKVRASVFALRNTKAITARDNPRDARIVEIHKDSVEQVRLAIFGS